MTTTVILFIALGVLAVVVIAAAFVVFLQHTRVEAALRQAREQALADQARGNVDQESRRQALESAIRGLEGRLKEYDGLLREWEKDRAQKFGQLERELSNAAQATTKLQDTTGKLSNILGNVKLRGQWGERMAEDIIGYAGLLENVNFQKQVQMASSATRPDFIFLLPGGRKVTMDVKFPLDNYLKVVNATSDLERDMAQKEFFKNVRARVKELQSRDYVNPQENTLDFVLLFIPNEQVFAFIHEQEPGIMDEALKQKVVLCSPFTLYAMLAVIRQAHENFRYEKDLRKIIQSVDQFVGYYETFKGRFEEIGKRIEDLGTIYADVREKSFKNLDVKIRHIDELKKGRELSSTDS
ncbi:MAG: DNA recombination protein RmuC [Candidatus Omnitrophica bacterium]|nr:DNA recombination protein RmuC [Candidatus Omnitrophota bacterium]